MRAVRHQTAMDTSHTLVKKTADNSTKGEVKIVDGLQIRAPYTSWNVKNMLISAPVQGTSKADSRVTFYTSGIKYKYLLPDGTSKVAPLKIEPSNVEGKMVSSPWGFAEILVYIEKEKLALLKKENPNFKQEGTGKHSVTISLPAGKDTTIGFLKVMQDIYIKCCEHMNAYGQEGKNPVLPGIYGLRPDLGPAKPMENFKYPMAYTTKEGYNSAGGKIKVIDADGDIRMQMGAKLDGRYGIEILNRDFQRMNYEDLIGQGFTHVPLIIIDDLYVGTVIKLRRKIDSTIIWEVLPPKTMDQAPSIREIKERAARGSEVMIEEAANAFNDPTPTGEGDYEVPPTEYNDEFEVPEPIPTPAPVLQKTSPNASRPAGSARAMSRVPGKA